MAGIVALMVTLTPSTAFAGGGRSLAQDDSTQGIDLTPVIEFVCDLIHLSLICPEESSGETGSAAVETPQPPQSGTGVRPPDTPSTAVELPLPPLQPPVTAPAIVKGSASSAVSGPQVSVSSPVLPGSQPSGEAPEKVGLATARNSAGPLVLAQPAEVDLSPGTIALAASVSILGLILIGFPAELFNKTMRENYSSLKRLFPWLGRAQVARGMGWQVWALVASSAFAGLIGSFQKVRDWNPPDVVIVALSLAVGFFVTNAVYELASAAAARELEMPPRIFKSYPGALPFVALFVAISTAGGLQPAYVYGHIAGSRIEDSTAVALRSRAMQTAAASVALLIFAIVCWALRAVVSSPIGNGILAGIVIVGLNRLVFALVPATFLDGLAPFQYSRALWASLYIPTLLAFLLLVLLPAIKNSGGGPIAVSVALFVLFAGLSLGVWAYFKRSKPAGVQAQS